MMNSGSDMLIDLNKESMEALFLQYLGEIFERPEVVSATVKEVVITRETIAEAGKKAFEASFHDTYSDVDLSLKIRLPENGSVTAEEYMKRIDRFGINEDTALGWMFVPANKVFRIIFRNGMRYDLLFEFEYEGDVAPVMEAPAAKTEDNPEWPMDNINQFWFIQTQALGKLYRPNYVSDHFAVILKQNGLRHIRFHDLRHSCASLLLSLGRPMKEIQDWLGHSDMNTTANIYSHLDSHSKIACATAIGEALE